MAETKTSTTKKKSTTKKEVGVKKPTKVVIKNKKSVMFVASEANPFAGTGGLADVIGSLPKALAKNGNFDVRVIIPLYQDFDAVYREKLQFVGNYNVDLSWRNQYCGLFTYELEGVTYYFIDNEYYFKRSGLYGFFDDGERFAFFSKAVLVTMKYLNWYPDIMHCHDWQTALSVIYLKTLFQGQSGFDRIKPIFTIHNIEYQGKYGYDLLGDLFGLPDYVKPLIDCDGCINLMKGAMVYAEMITTVSPTYADEIKYDYFGHGLSGIVNMYGYKTCGILNGIDEVYYNPSKDEKLFAKYSHLDLSGKAVCKAELQKMLGLPVKDSVPLIAVISRLVSHKGVDLIKGVIDGILSEDVQLVILGKGDAEYEDFFKHIAGEYPTKCKTVIAFNKDLSAKIYSAADIFLMPSKQEPCGLSQMIACKYGAVPVVRKTGGLADSIYAYNFDRNHGNGFIFENYNAHEMLYVLKDAIYTYGNKDVWGKLVKEAMQSDFSWNKSAIKYEQLYLELLN